ncbi:MAG: SRPBCC family protein [Pseudomonadales bacterium]
MSVTPQVFVQIIAAERSAVWKALTRPEFTSQYWHGTRVRSDFRVGSVVEFLVEGDEVGCRGEVLISEPPTTLSYTWQFPGNPRVRDEAPSRVTFHLETLGAPSGEQATRLTVIHDHFPSGSHMPEMVRPGWPAVLAGLKTLLETGQTPDFSSMT